MGGGVIIKPVLDAIGVADVAAINLLSGCTVIGMTSWSVGKSIIKKESVIDLRISTPLAIGAAAGGIVGKDLFRMVAAYFADPNTAGGVQACLLMAATIATLIYTIRKDQIRSWHIQSMIACFCIGAGLGILGSFLGIGGGPFNMAVLYLFFSMGTKVASQNSLYVILISQVTALLRTLMSGEVPSVVPMLLLGMILCGVLGSEAGSRVNKRLTEKKATALFEGAMLLVIMICVFNMNKFFR